MPLTQKHVDELKAIYKQDFDEDLSDAEAWAMAHRLINIFRLLLRPDKSDRNSANSGTFARKRSARSDK